MPEAFKGRLLWPAVSVVLLLPCAVVLLLDGSPGTPFTDHLPSAAGLFATGICVVLRPLPGPDLCAPIPEEHKGQFIYALRAGVLPLAALFSDWREPLAQLEETYSMAMRLVPTGTAVVVLTDACGIVLDPAGTLFFLTGAVGAAMNGIAALGFLRARLQNIQTVESKLREQIRFLAAGV